MKQKRRHIKLSEAVAAYYQANAPPQEVVSQIVKKVVRIISKENTGVQRKSGGAKK